MCKVERWGWGVAVGEKVGDKEGGGEPVGSWV